MEYEPVIGLEVHVEINSRSKVFCACPNDFHSPPNSNVCPVCLGMPGVLPVLNVAMVDASMAVGLALNCTISRWSKMDRKHYFYPDLAKSYQISQYDLPLCHEGYLDIEVDGASKRVGITRAHMEEDTARNTHTLGAGVSGVDFNRCGVPLLEIVTEPDIFSADEAFAYLTSLKQILEYLNVSDCNMEEGSLRAEPNISVRPKGSTTLGVKTEVKNVASFSGVRKAIEFEIKRQVKALDSGEAVVQETRGWDADRGITLSQRAKESAHDYRYFPDPDLMPVVVDDAWEERIRQSLPELPQARKRRFREDLGLSDYDAGVVAMTKDLADYFDAVVVAGAPAKQAANWITGDLLAALAEGKSDITACKMKPEALASMIGLIGDGTISGTIAKELLPDLIESGGDPKAIVEARGLVQISDSAELEELAQTIIRDHPGPAQEFRDGNKKAIGFLVGQAMKATKGKGNPKLINQILTDALSQE
jgi:aspartyl-tRNA(Asn)/glutamyl-tRNA(Gln) amidotransferase subunit B